jgi:hypothetical protein
MALKRFTYPKTSATISFTEDATVANGGLLPPKVKVVAGYDGTAVHVVKTDASGRPDVTVFSSALPAGASTSAKQDTGNTSLSSIDSKLGSIGQKTMAASAPVTLASDQSPLPVSQSGTWNITNIAGTVSLPTGAATSALQTAGNTTLTSIDGKTPALGQAVAAASLPVVLTAAQLTTLTPLSTVATTQSGTWNVTNISGTVSLPTGAATSALQSTGNTSLSSIDVKTPALVTGRVPVDGSGVTQPVSMAKTQIGGLSGNSPGSATVSTVSTITAPANVAGFILVNLDTSSANIRYRIGAVASATSGQQLQPGRDTGFIPCGANISICAESGTQNYDIQWVIQ